MTSLRVFPSERLICVFPACAEAHCVLGFPYRCVGSGSRLTVKAGAGAFFFFLSAPASIQLYRGGAQRSAFTPRRADTHTRIYTHSLLPPPTPYSSTGETPPTPGPERSSPPLKPGLHPAAHALEQRSSPR